MSRVRRSILRDMASEIENKKKQAIEHIKQSEIVEKLKENLEDLDNKVHVSKKENEPSSDSTHITEILEETPKTVKKGRPKKGKKN